MPQTHSKTHWHLPPGHEPGRQSSKRLGRRASVGKWFAAVLIFPCAVGLVGLGVYAAATHADDVGAGLILLCIAIGLFLFGCIIYMFRAKRPKIAKHFEVSSQTLELRRGDEVMADLAISDPGSVTEKIEVGLVCEAFSDYEHVSHTQHGRTTSRQTRDVIAHEQWQQASRSEPAQTFRFTIPVAAPYSHEGNCLSFAWRVTAREPTGLRRDPSSHQPLWVAP